MIDWLIGWLVGWLVDRLHDWFIDWLIGWLFDLLLDWLIENGGYFVWLVNYFIHSLNLCHSWIEKEIDLLIVLTRYITTWVDSRTSQSERGALTIMFDKYINTALFDAMKLKFRKITPIPENSHIQVWLPDRRGMFLILKTYFCFGKVKHN